jgi:hypothetical protein
VWVDWNGDGDVLDTNEAQTVQSVTASGTRTFSLTPPAGTTAGTKYLRIRFVEGSTAPNFSDTSSLRGEVEDYAVTVALPTTDFGDWAHGTNPTGAATASTSTTLNSNLRLGLLVDGEASVSASTTATVDDTTGSDDEDGATVPAIITEGEYVTIPATVLNNSGAVAYLSAWIDFNNDGVFNNTLYSPATATTGEMLVNPLTINTSASSQALSLAFPVPPDVSAGAGRGVRLRLANALGTGPTGAGATGEIEDYTLRICPRDMVAPEALSLATVGTAFSQTFTTTGATAPVVWALAGTMPPGLSFNSTTAVLSGTPTTAGSYLIKVTATDANGCADANNYTLMVMSGGGVVCNDLQAVPLSNGRRWGYAPTGPP